MKKNTEKISIDSLTAKNKKNWTLRYENPRIVIEESKQLLAQAEEILDKKAVAYAKLNIAVCQFLLSEHDGNMIRELYEIIDFFKHIEAEAGYVYALNLTANIFQSYGDYKKGLDYCKKAQELALKLNNNTDLADNHSVCGLIYSDLFDYENAIINFKKALKLRKTIKNKKAIASSLNLIARTNSLLENYTEALDFYNKALLLRTEINDLGGLPWTHIGLASTYEKMSDYDSAINHYDTALQLNEEFDDKRCKLHCYFGIGTIKSIIAPSKIAEDYLLEAKKIADELGSKPLLYKIYKNLSELYERMLEVPKAFVYYKLYHSNKEEVVNTKLQNALKNQEIVFAVEKVQKEAEIYRLKHIELKSAYDQIEEKNKEITDSISYARNIQMALLPSCDYVKEFFLNQFIFFKPRDIVSGDFYWINKVENKIIVAAADCTGHGVPGAFMSMLGISFLNEIVNKNKITQPNLILNELRTMVINSLNQTETEKAVSDGMDIALVSINTENLELEFSGAYNPLWIYRKAIENNQNEEYQLTEIKADRMPIGKYVKDKIPFTNQEFQLQENDTIYLFSDGYVDQFGGGNSQKFKKKRFKELLSTMQTETMAKQKDILDKTLTDWSGEEEQLDDIIIIGLKV